MPLRRDGDDGADAAATGLPMTTRLPGSRAACASAVPSARFIADVKPESGTSMVMAARRGRAGRNCQTTNQEGDWFDTTQERALGEESDARHALVSSDTSATLTLIFSTPVLSPKPDASDAASAFATEIWSSERPESRTLLVTCKTGIKARRQRDFKR